MADQLAPPHWATADQTRRYNLITVCRLAKPKTDRIPTGSSPEQTDEAQSRNGAVCLTETHDHHPRVAVLFERFGPYHIARLNHAAQHMRLYGIELSATDTTYSWTSTQGSERFPRHTLSKNIRSERSKDLIERVSDTLAMIRPDAVAIAGWSDPGALAALSWCLQSGIASVLMSDSTEFKKVRRPWKEAIKRRVVSLFGSALVAGRPQREYLTQLGMAKHRIFDGFNVIDNEFFRSQADAVRKRADDERLRLGLPRNYFLSAGRFIEEKNLFRLLNAFERYRCRAGTDAWDLVLLGDGKLRPQLLAWTMQRGLREVVHMPGFRQYEDLPVHYGLAQAFVLASTSETWGLVVNEAMAAGLPVIVSNRCGCAADLVTDGRNGFSFDPFNERELADVMLKMASRTFDRASTANAARATIAEWTLGRFTSNLRLAVDVALRSRYRGGIADRLLVQALIRRPS